MGKIEKSRRLCCHESTNQRRMENVLFKFLEWNIKPSQIAMNLKAIINQRLVRKVCEQCRISYNPSRENLSLFKGFNWSNNFPNRFKTRSYERRNDHSIN